MKQADINQAIADRLEALHIATDVNTEAFPNIIALFNDALKRHGNATACTSLGHSLSYRELDRLAANFAAWLSHESGLFVGDRIAVQMPNLIQYFVVVLGALRAGMVVVNTNPQYKPSEMEHQFTDAGVKGIIILNTFAYKLEEVVDKTDVDCILLAEVGDMLGALKGAIVDFMIKRVKKLVPEYNLPNAVSFQQALKQGKQHAYDRPDLEPQDIALLQYTGGTTGVAKGAALSHRNLVANIEQVAAWMRPQLLPGKETTICALPLYHVFALMVNCFGMMRIGAHNVLITDPRNLRDFIKTLKNHPFTVITGVNTLYNGLLNKEEFATVDFSHLKVAVAGGMALQQAVADKWQTVTGNRMVEGYGLSETAPLLCCNPIDGNDRLGTIGLPVSSTEIKIADDDGKPQNPGDYGEIWARGPQVMTGYWNNEAETALVMEGEWFKTGDIAFFSHDGFLKIVDRKKEMILVGGMNVYPNEVEDVIAMLPEVLEVGVVGVPDKKNVEAVAAFIVLNEAIGRDEIMKHCRDHMAAYKLPKHITFCEELPKTNVGKILRRELKNLVPQL